MSTETIGVPIVCGAIPAVVEHLIRVFGKRFVKILKREWTVENHRDYCIVTVELSD
jgi:CDP-glycerol glycerophosphotransferase (TagB/SpsB family)